MSTALAINRLRENADLLAVYGYAQAVERVMVTGIPGARPGPQRIGGIG